MFHRKKGKSCKQKSFLWIEYNFLIFSGRTLYNTALEPVGHVVPEVQIPEDVENMSWLSLQTILAGREKSKLKVFFNLIEIKLSN